MQLLAQAIWRESPELVDMTMAELAYQGGMAKSAPPSRAPLRLWSLGGDCVGWGWFFPPDVFEYAVHPEHRSLLPEIFDWFDSEAPSEAVHRVAIRNADTAALTVVRDRGFVADPEHIWMRLNHRTLREIESPELPKGYRLRSVDDYDGDITKRVEVHQRSWAELGTRVSLDTYPGVMSTWPYRGDLDFVLETDDGTPAAFALGWYDEENRVGEFEPVGTDPRFRGQGLGRATLLLGMERFREIGAMEMIVASRGDAGHPGPSKLYESAGFRELSRHSWFMRESQ